jgi:hypothetical protein
MLRTTICNYAVRLLLVGSMVLGGSQYLRSGCCMELEAIEQNCSAPGCSQEVYWYRCIGGDPYATDIGYVSCCATQFPSDYLIGYCAGPEQPGPTSASTVTRTLWVRGCSDKYVLVEIPVSET